MNWKLKSIILNTTSLVLTIIIYSIKDKNGYLFGDLLNITFTSIIKLIKIFFKD